MFERKIAKHRERGGFEKEKESHFPFAPPAKMAQREEMWLKLELPLAVEGWGGTRETEQYMLLRKFTQSTCVS